MSGRPRRWASPSNDRRADHIGSASTWEVLAEPAGIPTTKGCTDEHRLTAVATTTIIDHHLFALVDEYYPGEEVPAPHKTGNWVCAGRSSILVESPYDNLDVILRLEERDDEPGPRSWDDIVTVTVECPSGIIGLDQITAGSTDTGFSLTKPGTYSARIACCNGATAWQAYPDTLARFNDVSDPQCRQAIAQIDIEEEYLVRFWPAD